MSNMEFETIYCNYADENYEHHQRNMVNHVIENGIFDYVCDYTREWLVTTEFYKENKSILDRERLAGYMLWKPFIILDVLEKAKENQIVVYMDVGDVPNKGISDYVKKWMKNNDLLITLGGNKNRQMTKRDTFILMDCEEEKYYNAIQVEAGFFAAKKTTSNIAFIREWLEYCKDERILTDIPNQLGVSNFDEFIDHRHDQSILSLLQVKYNIQTSSKHRGYVGFNVNMHKKGHKYANGGSSIGTSGIFSHWNNRGEWRAEE